MVSGTPPTFIPARNFREHHEKYVLSIKKNVDKWYLIIKLIWKSSLQKHLHLTLYKIWSNMLCHYLCTREPAFWPTFSLFHVLRLILFNTHIYEKIFVSQFSFSYMSYFSTILIPWYNRKRLLYGKQTFDICRLRVLKIKLTKFNKLCARYECIVIHFLPLWWKYKISLKNNIFQISY